SVLVWDYVQVQYETEDSVCWVQDLDRTIDAFRDHYQYQSRIWINILGLVWLVRMKFNLIFDAGFTLGASPFLIWSCEFLVRSHSGVLALGLDSSSVQ
uniref:Uncharacterized protein n=1 Tax=Cannabis sativa TaxID=3483 RepID=A0A803QRY9_CANSA